MSEMSRFRATFGSPRGNASQALLKASPQSFNPVVSSFSKGLSCKTSKFVRSYLLGLFLNTLIADDKYSLHKRENFTQLIQTQKFKKSENLYAFFFEVF